MGKVVEPLPPELGVGRQWPPGLQVRPVPQKLEGPGVHGRTQMPLPVVVRAQTGLSEPSLGPQSAVVVQERVQIFVWLLLPPAQVNSVLASSQSDWTSQFIPAWLIAPGIHTLTDCDVPRSSPKTVGLQKNPAAQSRTLVHRSRHSGRPSVYWAPKVPRGQGAETVPRSRHCFCPGMFIELTQMPRPFPQLLPSVPVQGPRTVALPDVIGEGDGSGDVGPPRLMEAPPSGIEGIGPQAVRTKRRTRATRDMEELRGERCAPVVQPCNRSKSLKWHAVTLTLVHEHGRFGHAPGQPGAVVSPRVGLRKAQRPMDADGGQEHNRAMADSMPLAFVRREVSEQRQRADELYALMQRRRSVREFSDEPIDLEVVRRCIDTAAQAPSGANKQPWTYVLVTSPALKKRIREAAEAEEQAFYGGRASDAWLADIAVLGTDWRKPFLETAPALIVVFAQSRGATEADKHYYVQESVGLSAGFLIAALHFAGLATLTHTPSPMGFLSELLERPKNERAVLLMPVGLPAEGCTVPRLERKPREAYLVER